VLHCSNPGHSSIGSLPHGRSESGGNVANGWAMTFFLVIGRAKQ
jgi:hypothetical protein